MQDQDAPQVEGEETGGGVDVAHEVPILQLGINNTAVFTRRPWIIAIGRR